MAWEKTREEDNERKMIPHPYMHPVYKPGEIVLVSTRICELHEEAPAAGQRVEVCEGVYLTSDDPQLGAALREKEKARPHLSLVPVRFLEDVWLIEEEYIERLPS